MNNLRIMLINYYWGYTLTIVWDVLENYADMNIIYVIVSNKYIRKKY